MCFVTVIVPIFNAESTIRRCVESILDQSFTDIEIIIVDDGSTDKSGMICDAYSQTDCRIKVIRKENEGVSASRNLGLKYAVGDWITFVDADDWIDKDHIFSFVDAARNNADCDIVIHGFHLHHYTHNEHSFGYDYGQYDRTGIINRLYSQCMPGALWNKFFRRTMIERFNISFNTNFSFREDEDFVLSYLSKIQKGRFSNTISYHYYSPNWVKKYQRNDTLVNEELFRKMKSFDFPISDEVKRVIINYYVQSIINLFYIKEDNRQQFHGLYVLSKEEKAFICNHNLKLLLKLPEIVSYYIMKLAI